MAQSSSTFALGVYRRTALDTLPEVYALTCIGHGMEPEIADGAVLVFDKVAVVRSGDFVVVWRRPDLLPAGEALGAVRRVVIGPPPGAAFPLPRTSNEADTPSVLVERLNPKRSYSIVGTEVAGLHRCVGTTERDYHEQALLPAVEL
jgi:hypothetical protein